MQKKIKIFITSEGVIYIDDLTADFNEFIYTIENDICVINYENKEAVYKLCEELIKYMNGKYDHARKVDIIIYIMLHYLFQVTSIKV